MPLDISDLPRRYRTAHDEFGRLTERDLLTARDHILLTGDPGAGKDDNDQEVPQRCRHGGD